MVGNVPPPAGGAEVCCASLSSQLRAFGHDVHVVGWNGPRVAQDGFFPLLEPFSGHSAGPVPGYPHLKLGLRRAAGFMSRQVKRVRKLAHRHSNSARLVSFLRSFLPDVIHAHNPLENAYCARVASSRLGCKLVITAHHGGVADFEQQSVFRRRLILSNLSSADKVICVTSAIRDKCVSLGIPDERLVVISNPVDVSFFTPREYPGSPAVLFAGRFVERKGIDVLVDAFRGTDVKVLIAGDGPCRPNVPDNFTLLGELPHSQMPDFLARGSLLVLPSFSEGLPLVVLESFACARPVVASDIPGLGDFVIGGKTGYLFPKGDPCALREAVLKALPHVPSLGMAARELVSRDCSLPSIAGRTLEVYYSILQGS